MRITYRKRNNQVIMLGQGVDTETLASATVQKDPRMEQGYQMFYENGAIRYEKPTEVVEKDEFLKDIASIDKAVDQDDKEEMKKILLKFAKKLRNQD